MSGYSIEATISLIDNFSAGMNKIANATERFGNNVNSKLSGVGKAMMAAGAATTVMGFKALKSFGQFEASLNQAAVVAGGTSKDIDGLAKVANKMGAELPISAQQAANAMVAMARDGASIGTIKKEFPAIAKAATAAGADLEMTASVVQQAMNVWGKALKSPEQAAAILVQVANQSNASIESMQQALANVGPTAAAAGYSLQDTANAIGLLTNSGMSAAQASDNLNHAITLMQTPTKQAQGYMNELGISFRDAEGNMKPLPQIASELNSAFDNAAKSSNNFGKAQKDAALKAMFGQDGMKVMRTLMKSVADETDNASTSWNAASKAIEKFAGTTATANKNLDRQASEMQKNMGAKLDKLSGNWETLRNDALKSTSSITGGIVDVMSATLDWADKTPGPLGNVIRGFVGLMPVIGPVMTAVGTFITNAQKIAGVAASAARGLGNLASKIVGLPGHFSRTGKAAGDAATKTGALGSKAKSAGAAAGSSAASMLAFGASAMMIGVGVGAALAGMALLVDKINELSSAGMQGIGTLAAVTVAFSAMVGVMGLVGKVLGNTGVQAGVAYAGMALLIFSFTSLIGAVTKFSQTGMQGVIALAAVTAAIIAVTAAFAIFGPALTASTAGILAFGAAMLMVGAGVYLATTGIANLVNAFANLINALNNFNMSGQQVIAIMGAIGTGFAMMITNFVITLAAQMPLIAQKFVEMFVTINNTIISNLPTLIQQGIQIVVSLINGIAQGMPMIVAAITNLMVAIMEAIGSNAPRIVAAFAEMLAQLLQAAVQIMPLLIQVIGATMAAMIATVASFAGSFRQIGGVILQALISGVTGKKFDAVAAASDVIKSAGSKASSDGMAAFKAAGGQSAISSLHAIANKKGDHQQAGSSLGKAAASGIKSQSSAARSAGSSLGSRAASGASSQRGAAHSAGANIGSGIASGISSMAGHVMSVAASLAARAVAVIRSALRIHSPSRVLRDQVGKYVSLGMAVGMERYVGAIDKASTALAQAAVVSVPAPDTSQLISGLGQINDLVSRPVTSGVNTNVAHDLTLTTQPAYINLSLGGSNWSAYVDDISREQGSMANLNSNYRF